MNQRAAGTNGAAPLFRVIEASRQWRNVEALKDVSLEINAGEIILLAGPSGAGKSTLLRPLMGGLRPTRGRIEVNGVDIASMSTRDLRRFRATCGVVEQGSLLVPQLDVHHNVLAGRLAKWPWHRILLSTLWPLEREAVRAMLEDVGLPDRQWDVTGNLSGGQQQRVAIARALISSPSVVLADEPIASLDATAAAHATSLIVDLARQAGGTVVFCTHWVSLVLPFVDRVIGIRDGRVAIDRAAGEDLSESLSSLYEGSRERL